MDSMNMEKLREVAQRKGIVDAGGNANVIALNYMSAVYTSPLLSEVWEKTFPNHENMSELLGLMREAHNTDQYDVFFGILKSLYIITGCKIPDEIGFIIACDSMTTKEMFAHEFLADFEDLMYDFREEAKEAM